MDTDKSEKSGYHDKSAAWAIPRLIVVHLVYFIRNTNLFLGKKFLKFS